nr:hypothetical protein [Tanacetum cinerariifolium]
MTMSGVGKCRQVVLKALQLEPFSPGVFINSVDILPVRYSFLLSFEVVPVNASFILSCGSGHPSFKLVRYKVGRVEQLETSEQAKSRGDTAVIQKE